MGVRHSLRLSAARGPPPALQYLQSPVHHVVGAGGHADGLLPLQLHGKLGVESKEVDELRCSVDLRLDHGFSLVGGQPMFKDGRQARARPPKGTKTFSGLTRTEEGKDLVLRHPNLLHQTD